ncbi:hypothetical protein Lupro_08170 [Lutibacter profundi]|uniref:Outer membrane protein beta-barrel domain-containing protein n=1 Tax=Lutibacter profundi TaxID=1622118 RepID=A0A120IEC4_9FLAO|nr:outer membrane beta-barrel protein [Lutibacter profundi]AMC11230.1 hypothetical protein Lupro_08170 [Lutibacter profundi]
MKDYKNIDRIFQENLKDFEVFPPNNSWNAIEKQLAPTSKKRHIPIWFKVSSVAALLVLFFSIGTIFLLPTNNFTKNLIFNSDKQKEKLNTKDTLNSKNTVIKSNTINEKESVKSIFDFENEKNILSLENVDSKKTDENVEKNGITNKHLNRYYSLTDGKNLPLKNNINKKVLGKDFLKGRLSVATIFAPIYINSFGSGSGIDSQFKENTTSGNSSYSYGVKFAYKLNNKFSIQSGVNLINLGYTTNDVFITPGVAVISLSNLSSNPISSKSSNISSKEITNTGNINQIFGYVEIPVEIKYNVTNGKLGVNLVGGFSTLLLNKDEVFIETSNFSQSLGSSNNLRSVNFSGNIGLDVDYSIHKNLYINISPMFKVQTNTFSKNAGSIQPYYLGVYTGLNYKF